MWDYVLYRKLISLYMDGPSMLYVSNTNVCKYQTKVKDCISPEYDESIETFRGFIFGGIFGAMIWCGILALLLILL